MTQLANDSAQQPRTPVRPYKLAHVVLRTTQFEALVHWYKTVLQAEASFEMPGLSFITYDDEHHRIAIAGVPGLPDRPPLAKGLEHIAFTYRALGDIVHTYERLKQLGIRPYWTINHGPTLSFYYRDPDNNQIELQVDNFATTEEINAYLAAEYSKNPIGAEFDPDDLVRRFHAGEPEAELRKRPDVGPRGLEGLPTI